MSDDPSLPSLGASESASGREPTIGSSAGRASIEDALTDEKYQKRIRAVEALARLQSNDLLDRLEALLSDPDPGVRQSVARSMILRGPIGIRRLLQACLNSPRHSDKAVERFLLDEGIFPYILEIIQAPDLSMRLKMIEMGKRIHVFNDLKRINTMLPSLIEAAQTDDETIQVRAANLLGQFNDHLAASALADMLMNTNPRVRGAALSSIGWNVEGRGLEPRILPLLDDADPEIRLQAAELLAETRPQAVLHAISELLTSPDADIRREATLRIGWIGGIEAGKHLLMLLDDPDRFVQLQAIESLGRAGTRFAVGRLMQLAEQNAMLREGIIETLGLLRAEQAKPLILRFMAEESRAYQRVGLQALIRIGGTDMIEMVYEAWLSEPAELDYAVGGLIDEDENPYRDDPLNSFLAILHHNDPQIRGQALELISALFPHSPIETALIPMLADKAEYQMRNAYGQVHHTHIDEVAAQALTVVDSAQARAALDQWQQNRTVD